MGDCQRNPNIGNSATAYLDSPEYHVIAFGKVDERVADGCRQIAVIGPKGGLPSEGAYRHTKAPQSAGPGPTHVVVGRSVIRVPPRSTRAEVGIIRQREHRAEQEYLLRQ